ncbi:MAG: exosome complex protein Rrp42 [Thermoplasmataceae archaeon]
MPKDALGVLSEIKKSFIIKRMKEGKRGDGRKPDEYREIKIQTNYVPRAAGSALVELGKTKILVGIKIDAGEPFPDTPNLGVFTTNVELLPMAFPTFESGPPNEMSIEVARVVDRGIRESKMIDFEKLVIEPGKKVWIIFADINVLDYDGNLFDACSYGVVAALKSATLPASRFGGTDSSLPINNTPVSVTIVKLDDVMVSDPDLEEEQMSTARITITTTEDGHIRAMQKGDTGTFEMDEIRKAIKMSSDTGSIFREKYLK